MPNSPAPVISLATRRTVSHSSATRRAAAAGAALTTPDRLFQTLTAGDDFGGIDALTESLARSRDAQHPAAANLAEMVCALFDVLAPPERAILAQLDAAWMMRTACSAEIGFCAGVAAGRAR